MGTEHLAVASQQFQYVAIRGLLEGPPLYVLDSNVLSVVDGMIRHATPAVSAGGDKVVDLIRRLRTERDSRIADDFALVEAAQFGDIAGFRADTLIVRDAAYRIIDSRPDDIYRCIGSLEGFYFPAGYDDDLGRQLAAAIDRSVRTFVPAYVAALLLEQRLGCGDHQQLAEEDVLAVLDVLNSELDFVPGTLWIALLLACCGIRSARDATMKVFKTGRRDRRRKTYHPKKNALSAAWDLATLQVMSEHIPIGTRVVLVTGDKGLASLIDYIEYRPPGLDLDTSSIDPKRAAARDRLIAAYRMRRLARLGDISSPDRQLCADVVEKHEKLLGIASGVPDQLRRGPLVALPDLPFRDTDMAHVRLILAPRTDAEREDGVTQLFAINDYDDCRTLLHSLLRVGALAAEAVARRTGRTTRDTIVAALPHLGECADYGLSLLDYVERDQRRIQFGARYLMLTRPDQARRHVRLLGAAGFRLMHEWTDALPITPAVVLDEVERALQNSLVRVHPHLH